MSPNCIRTPGDPGSGHSVHERGQLMFQPPYRRMDPTGTPRPVEARLKSPILACCWTPRMEFRVLPTAMGTIIDVLGNNSHYSNFAEQAAYSLDYYKHRSILGNDTDAIAMPNSKFNTRVRPGYTDGIATIFTE
ncbi:hypothetical protein ACJJTC_014364 [Scirpophaga incertulas]